MTSFVLAVGEAVVVAFLLCRLRRLEDEIFIKSRTIRAPGSPIIRCQRMPYAPNLCGHAAAHRRPEPSAAAEFVDLLQRVGNQLPQGNPGRGTNHETRALDFPNGTAGRHPAN